MPLTFGLMLAAVFCSSASADERVAAANVHVQKGRYDEAIELYEELAAEGVEPVQVALGRSRALEAIGDLDKAGDKLKQAAEQSPQHAGLLARLAEVQFRRGRYAEAEPLVERALKIEPQHLQARLVQADLLAETGRIKEANEAYRWFVRHYNQAQPEDAESLILVGRGALQYARWNGATSIFDFVVNTLCPDALKADPNCWEAHHLAGSLLLEKYNRAQALPELRLALAINPRAADVLAALADAALQSHELDEAEEFLGQALAVNPRHVAALQLKADVRLQRGKLAEARQLLQEALDVNPHEQRTLARLAALYLIQDDLPLGNRYDRLLSNLDAPDRAGIDDPTRFEQLVLELAGRNPRPGYFLTILGQTLEARRQYDAAERTYRHAIAVMPELAEPKTALGLLGMRTGDTQQAARLLDEAFKADPYHVRVSNMRKVVKLLDGYETIATDHFVIRIDAASDRLLGQYMAEYLESIYPELVEQFGYEPPQRTHFEVYSSAKGLSAHQWFSARMVGLPWIQTIGASTGVIVAMASPNAVDEPYNWARVLRHEFVHVITLQQTGFRIPHWFTEALAVTSEGYARPAVWDRLIRERVPKHELWSLDELNEVFARPESPEDWQFAYCQSRLYAQYMAETHGPETIPRMLDAYRNKRSTEQAIAAACGVSVEEFEQGYRKFLANLAAELETQDAPPDEKSLAALEQAHRAAPDATDATEKYKAALVERSRREPDDAATRKRLAQLALQEKDYTAACTHAEGALHVDVLAPETHALLGTALQHLQEHSRAIREYRVALELQPKNAAVEIALAQTLLAANQPDEARKVLETLLAREPDHSEGRALLNTLE